MARMSPVGALVAGAAAGIVGSFVQDMFFRATGKLQPKSSDGAFEPPEPQQATETATQTVARRAVEGLAQRSLTHKEAAGKLVHYLYGAAWGGAYGLAAAPLRGSHVRLGAAFGVGVWAISEGVVLPLFRLAALPTEYPAKVEGYAIAAHVVYGVAVGATFDALQRSPRRLMLAGLGARLLTRRWPGFVRPTARRVATPGLDLALRARAVADALQ